MSPGLEVVSISVIVPDSNSSCVDMLYVDANEIDGNARKTRPITRPTRRFGAL